MMEELCLSAAASLCRAETPFYGPIVFIDQYDNDQYDCAHAVRQPGSKWRGSQR